VHSVPVDWAALFGLMVREDMWKASGQYVAERMPKLKR
jgi:hypothetical protein